MRLRALTYLTLLLTANATVPTFAQERVARLKITDGRKGPHPQFALIPATISHEASFNRMGAPTQAELESSTFLVYTVPQHDAMRTVDQKKVAELEAVITVLRKNVKDISDINDALAKRLDEMEKRVAAGQ